MPFINVKRKGCNKMEKNKFNIQLFSEDLYFDYNQQVSLIVNVEKGLNLLVTGTDNMAEALNSLSENWHSSDAEKYGNEVASGAKTVIDSSRKYVASISGWMKSHGYALNLMNGNTVSFSNAKLDDSEVTIKEFSDDPTRRGLSNTNTASTTKSQLSGSFTQIKSALSKVMSAAESNPKAMPKGVVSDYLVPLIEAENGKVTTSINNMNDSLSNFLEKLSEAISDEATNSKSGTATTNHSASGQHRQTGAQE